MRASALAALLALGACAPATEVPEEPVATPTGKAAAAPASSPSSTVQVEPREPARLVPASELIGEWRIAGVNGQAIDAPYGITASITADRIHMVADCINVAWSYAAESGTIETKRVPVEGCGRGMTPQEEAIVAAIDAATGFGRVPSNAVEIFTTDRRVTLFSQ
jgi:hypothetical protein